MSFEQICESQNAELKAAIKEDFLRLAGEKKLTSLEKPREFVIRSEMFSIENNLLTPTFKLKRNVAKQAYKADIDQLYAKIVEAENAQSANRT